MSTWLIYLWTRLDGINGLLAVLIIVGGIAAIPTLLYGVSDNDKAFINTGIKLAIGTLISGILFVAVPTKKDAAIIYVTPKLLNSKIITDDCPELAKLGIKALKQQLIEFTKGKEEIR